jgi:hypothetical protein
MADNDTEYKLWIEAFTPATIPMRRLAEYMVQFARLLANDASVNFKQLDGGSTTLSAAARYEADPKINARLQGVKRADAANDAIESFERLNEMLSEDNAIGKVYRRATSATVANEVLYLQGKEIPKQEKIGPFTEQATIKARLFRIGGRDETAHAQLLDSAGRVWNGALSQDQATKMSKYGLYQWFSVSGNARWTRAETGEWELVDFRISDFHPLADTSLEADIQSLREIKGSQWGKVEDPTAFIQELRKDDDGLH